LIKIIKGNQTGSAKQAVNDLCKRDVNEDLAEVEALVREILEAVRTGGDDALRMYSERFDGFFPEVFEIGRGEMRRAFEEVDDDFRKAIIHAAENIRTYHEKQKVYGYEMKGENNVVMGQIVRGLTTVGLYVPGGTAAYPSTVLMNAIPAKIAGVENLIMTTPKENREIFATAYLAGVDRIFLCGGAQAVAALAYGTERIPRVDKIVGPGNLYVATAKRLLFGQVDIDMVAGPSEIVIIADKTGNPEYIAADMLSQAEHDKKSAAILLTTDEKLAIKVSEVLENQLSLLRRKAIAEASMNENGMIVLCRSEDEMIDLANEIAPEHLEIHSVDPFAMMSGIRNAGSVFLGPYSPEPLGDYYAGTNHVLPTSGTARYASPLGVYDFVKRMSYTCYTKEALELAKDDIVTIGEAEGLEAHVKAVKIRDCSDN
jgi:histidinol dehydrogenase